MDELKQKAVAVQPGQDFAGFKGAKLFALPDFVVIGRGTDREDFAGADEFERHFGALERYFPDTAVAMRYNNGRRKSGIPLCGILAPAGTPVPEGHLSLSYDGGVYWRMKNEFDAYRKAQEYWEHAGYAMDSARVTIAFFNRFVRPDGVPVPYLKSGIELIRITRPGGGNEKFHRKIAGLKGVRQIGDARKAELLARRILREEAAAAGIALVKRVGVRCEYSMHVSEGMLSIVLTSPVTGAVLSVLFEEKLVRIICDGDCVAFALGAGLEQMIIHTIYNADTDSFAKKLGSG